MQAYNALVERRRKTETVMKADRDENTTGPQMAITARYLERLGREIEVQRQAVDAAQHRCEEHRQSLIEAMQKRKTLEKLKEHGLKAYLQDLNREEEQFINEMAINRHILNAN
jgi:flagellar export protein FliJ